MARLFLLIRRKGNKRFLGAIPTRKGATMASLRRVKIKGFVFRIVTEKQLKAIILRQRPRTARRTIRKIRRVGRKSRRRKLRSRRMKRRIRRRVKRRTRRFRRTRRRRR